MAASDFVTESQVDSLVTTLLTTTNTTVKSTTVLTIESITQSAYDALGSGRSASVLYVITS